MCDRIFKLSHPRYHTSNLHSVIAILSDSDYPLKFIFNILSKRLRNLINFSRDNIFSTSNPLPNNSICNSHPTPSPSFFIIPYISNLSDKISMIFRNLNRSPAFVVHNKLNIFIKLHKDNLSKFKDVVYKLNCIDCNASFVGQTSKQLHTRLKKHKANISAPTDSLSIVSTHRLTGHEFNWDEVLVLDEEPVYRRRLFSEMLHISSQGNSLNIQNDTLLLDASYSWIIDKLLTVLISLPVYSSHSIMPPDSD